MIIPNRPYRVKKDDLTEIGDWHAPGYGPGTVVISTNQAGLYRVSRTSYCYNFSEEQLEKMSLDELDPRELANMFRAETPQTWAPFIEAWKVAFLGKKLRKGCFVKVDGNIFGVAGIPQNGFATLEPVGGVGIERRVVRLSDITYEQLNEPLNGSLARWGLYTGGCEHLNDNDLRRVFEILSGIQLMKTIELRDYKQFSRRTLSYDSSTIGWGCGGGTSYYFKRTDEVLDDGAIVYKECTAPLDREREDIPMAVDYGIREHVEELSTIGG